MTDHYETLQVHPKADADTIKTAYEHLADRYAAHRLDGAADELQQLARRKRDELERAYAVLRDPDLRAAYDAERAEHQTQAALAASDLPDEEQIDYRPLPPAQGKDRPRDFNAYPLHADQPADSQRGRTTTPGKRTLPTWAIPAALVGVLTFSILMISLFVTNGGMPRTPAEVAGLGSDPAAASNPAATAPDNSAPDNSAPAVGNDPAAASGNAPSADAVQQAANLIAEYDAQVVNAQQVAENLPDNPDAWVAYGNALYDSVQVVREITRQGPLYEERIGTWLEAADAYAQAIELGIDSPQVQSDRGVSLCYYGADADEPARAAEGLALAREAFAADSSNPRIPLNLGICLVSVDPPQTAEAVALWQEVAAIPDENSGVVQQARILLQEYQ